MDIYDRHSVCTQDWMNLEHKRNLFFKSDMWIGNWNCYSLPVSFLLLFSAR